MAWIKPNGGHVVICIDRRERFPGSATQGSIGAVAESFIYLSIFFFFFRLVR